MPTENQSHRVTSLAITFSIFEILFFGLFITSRIKNKSMQSLDTYLMAPAFFFCYMLVIICFLFVGYAGLGKHWVELSPEAITNHLKLELAMIFTYIPAVCLPKLAILTLYLRIFTSKFYRYATYIVAVVPIVTALVSTIIAFSMCRPFAYNWDKNIQGGHCIDKERVYTWISLPNIVTDVAMLILPIPVIWQLQMSRYQKIGLMLTLMTGSIGIITAIIRFAIFFTLDPNQDQDLSWYSTDAVMWTTAEPGVYMIAVCLPSLRALFKALLRNPKFAWLRSMLGRRQTTTGHETGSLRHGGFPSSRNRTSFKLTDIHPRSFRDGNDHKGMFGYHWETGSQISITNPESTRNFERAPRNSDVIHVEKEFSVSISPPLTNNGAEVIEKL